MTRPQVTARDPSWDDIQSWRDARRLAEKSGWKPLGTGDWAWVYGTPDETLAWRITPFDPAYEYFAAVCEASPNPHLPRIVRQRTYPQGGSSVVLEKLDEVAQQIATEWTTTFAGDPDPTTAAMVQTLETAARKCKLPLFMGLDINPGNVRRRPDDGTLVLIDAFWINGMALFELVVSDPQRALDLFGRRRLLDWVHIPAMDAPGREQVLQALARL